MTDHKVRRSTPRSRCWPVAADALDLETLARNAADQICNDEPYCHSEARVVAIVLTALRAVAVFAADTTHESTLR